MYVHRTLRHPGSFALHWPLDSIGVRYIALLFKRCLDLVGALALLTALSPLFLIIAALIKWRSRGPAFFVQKRVGYGCQIFPMYKFRTMVDGADKAEGRLATERPERTFVKITNDPRVTRLGRVLRKYSFDELPQLWNVVRGDMSLVGPRPILLSDFRKFPLREQMRRFSVLPGMTGLWQVRGRSQTSDERRMALDLQYVDEWSIRRDLEIVMQTLPAVVRATGAV